jgi:hypothetical protein
MVDAPDSSWRGAGREAVCTGTLAVEYIGIMNDFNMLIFHD